MQKRFQQLFQEFIYESQYINKVRPETIRGYIQTFQLFIKIVPECSIENLSTQDIIQFFRILEERKRVVSKRIIKVGIKKSTVSTYARKLNTFFEWLVIRKHIAENPIKKMRLPTPIYEDKKFLRKPEVEKIITAILSSPNTNILALKRNLVIFYLFLFCGLRREELLQLQVRDIDFARKIITVRAITSKSGLKREIPLHSIVLLHLKDYIFERRKYTTQYLIVSSTQDERLTVDGLKHFIDKLRIRSGVAFHVHQLRHTFAVNFLKSTNNLIKLKQLLGHKSIAMTSIYLRCLPIDEFRKDIEGLNIDSLM